MAYTVAISQHNKENLRVRIVTALGEHACALEQGHLTLRDMTAVLEQSSACVILTDLDSRILYVNPGFTHVTGYTAEEVMGRPVSLLRSSLTHADTFAQLWRALSRKGEWRGELLNRRKNGEHFWVDASITVLRNSDGVPERYLSTLNDISLCKQYEEQLFQRSNYDLLTDLPNRELIHDRLQQALDLAQVQSQRHRVAVLFINLCQFRRVNEVQGHDVGDDLLCQVAGRFQQVLAPTESLGRVGGDEFVVIMPEVSRLQAVEHLNRCLLDQVDQPFSVPGAELRIAASIGVALFPQDGKTADALVRHAGAAMQQVRGRKKSGYCFFHEEMNTQVRQSLEMEQALHLALEQESFEVWYQPLLDLKSRRIRGVEALVRWRLENGELVPPDHFIPQAEESGQILELGRWVLGQAVHQVAAWQRTGCALLGVAVNISPRQLLQPGFVEEVAGLLKASGLEVGSLELEITESIFLEVDAEDRVTEIFSQLHGMGVRVSIDDFGTGFSALGYLKRFSADVLKIDREFIRDIHHDVSAAMLCQAIIWMARGLSMAVVAEGVEVEEQLQMLRESGADTAQGFFIARPMPAEEAFRIINNASMETHEM